MGETGGHEAALGGDGHVQDRRQSIEIWGRSLVAEGEEPDGGVLQNGPRGRWRQNEPGRRGNFRRREQSGLVMQAQAAARTDSVADRNAIGKGEAQGDSGQRRHFVIVLPSIRRHNGRVLQNFARCCDAKRRGQDISG